MTWYYLFRIQEIYLFFIINARRWSLLLEPPNRRCVVRWVRARSNATYSQLLTNCSLPMVEVMIPVRWWRFFSFCSRPVVFNSIDDNFSNCLYSWCYTYINICIWIALSLSLSLVARTSRVHAGRWCMNGSRLVRSYLYHANCLCVFFKQSIKMHVTQYFISCLNWNEQLAGRTCFSVRFGSFFSLIFLPLTASKLFTVFFHWIEGAPRAINH